MVHAEEPKTPAPAGHTGPARPNFALVGDYSSTRRSFQEALISLAIMLLLIGVLLQFWIYNRAGVWAQDREHLGDYLWVAIAVAVALCLLALYRWHTLRKELEWRQRVDEELLLLREAVETMTIGLTITNADGRIRYVNPAEAQMHGFTQEELIGGDVRTFAPPDRAGTIRSAERPHSGRWSRESLNLHRDGSVFPVHLMSNVVLDPHGQPIGTVTSCEDISERKRAEDRLRESGQRLRGLAQHLEVVREEERSRIAQEIHDNLGASLTVLKLDLSMIEQRVSESAPDLLPRIHRMLESIDGTVDTVRSLARNLRPFLLDDVGLIAAIEWHVQEVDSRTGVHCRARLPEEELVLGEEERKVLFRAFQEAVTNALRHAAAKTVEVSLEEGSDGLVLVIRDDGVGIDPGWLDKPKGFGLMALRERVLGIGGHLEVVGGEDRGTVVRVALPRRPVGAE